MNGKKTDNSTLKAIGCFLIAYASMLAEWVLFKDQLRIEYPSIFGTAMKATGDIALLMLPYWFIGPRWRWTAILPVWLYAVWCVVNLAYFRFWGDLVPAAAVTMGGNVNGDLMGYGISLLRPSDILYVVIPAITTTAFFMLRPAKQKSFSTGFKTGAAVISAVAAVCGQYSYLHTDFAWNKDVFPDKLEDRISLHYFGDNVGQRRLYMHNGLAGYGMRYIGDIADILTQSVTLTDEERVQISDFLQNYDRRGLRNPTAGADLSNVVYIIVESLNSEMIGKKIEDFEVMPMLDSLSKTEGTIYFDNVVSQIKASSSSDGHLLLMTGLLPPEKIAYSITYGDKNRFPSLADALPDHNKILLLADDGVCWNEGNTLRNFRLGEPITSDDRPEYNPEILGRDGAMFSQATDMVKTARQPFFMTLMTISMHIPFKEKAWELPPHLSEATGLTQMEKDYANVCHQTDKYIGDFINSLPSNTIIFIASDHSQGVSSADDSSPAAVFMAVNTARTEHISRKVGQVNLYPATLDILGKDGTYGGIAPSAFNPCVDGTRDSYGNIHGNPTEATLDTLNRAYRISDLIIRGDYFESIGR